MPEPEQLNAMMKVFALDRNHPLHINEVRKRAATFLAGHEPSYGNAVTRLNELARSGYLIKVKPGFFKMA